MLKLIGPTTAWLRHASTAAASIVAAVSILAGLDPDTSAKLLAATKQALGGLTDLLTALGVIVTVAMAVWARWTAKPEQQIAAVNALPDKAVVPASDATLKASPWALAIGLLVALPLLGACSTGPLSTPQGQANTLGTSWALAKAGFAIYAAAPPCSATSGAVCSDPAVVAAVTKAATVADLAISKAQADILAAPDQTAVSIALKAGFDALAVFQAAMATYGAAVAPPAVVAVPAG